MIEKDIKIHVVCQECNTELQTILEKKSDDDGARFHFEMEVVPCPSCIPVEEPIEVTLHLNETERESIQIQ